MAKKFVLTAALQLQAPSGSNISSIVNQINRSLKGISVSVNVNIPKSTVSSLTQITKSMNNVSKATADTTSELEKFGKQSALAIRRFAAFSAATAGFIALAAAMKHSFSEAVAFDREMIRIGQVTGTSLKDLKGLSGEITRLATGFGVSSSKIASVATVLSQAGLSAKDTEKALEALTKTELSATFEDIKDTTEGAIAIMAQFGTGVEDLEGQLSAINSVAGKFAVESSDLITAVRRTGASFKASGGSLNELLALFTSVRATTRESAESIATGFRTIFTRIQRPKTIEYLKELGVELRDMKGQFIGPYEAVRKLSEALNSIPSTDPRFAQIIEELGGFRQVSKVIPLIQQFAISQKALNIAQQSSTSITDDAQKAQQALSVQLAKVREEFDALFRKIADNQGIRAFIDFALQLSSALIKVADAVEPLLPLIVGLGSIKLASGLGQFTKGFLPNLTGSKKFAHGGLVPGHGNGDSVHAMLTPGEFVLRKSAVSSLGLNNIQHMATGGLPDPKDIIRQRKAEKANKTTTTSTKKNILVDSTFGGAFPIGNYAGQTEEVAPTVKQLVTQSKTKNLADILTDFAKSHNKKLEDYDRIIGHPHFFSMNKKGQESFGNFFEQGIPKLMDSAVNQILPPELKLSGPPLSSKDIFEGSLSSVKGSFFEAFVKRSTGIFADNHNPVFDFENPSDKFANLFEGYKKMPLEAKVNDIKEQKWDILGKAIRYPPTSKLREFARGGSVGTDTIPAMLTPGEFVVSKEAVGRIGLGNMRKLNKFAKGGPVGNLANSARSNPFEAVFIASTLTSTIGRIEGFGKEVQDASTQLSGLVAQIIVLRAVIGSIPGAQTSGGLKAQAAASATRQAQLSAQFQKTNRFDINGNPQQSKLQSARNAIGIASQRLQNPNLTSLQTQRLQITQQKAIEAAESLGRERLKLEDRLLRRREQTIKLERQAKLAAAGEVGVPVFGAVAGAAGEHFSNKGFKQIEGGNFTGGQNNTLLGGALKGAATGAILGGTVGSVVPIIGNALGAVIGGIAGAGVGIYTAMNEAADQIRKVSFGKDLQILDRSIKHIQTVGDTAESRQRFVSQVTQLNRQTTANDLSPEQQADLKKQLKEAAPAIGDFLDAQAKASAGFEEFAQRTGELRFIFHGLENIDFADLQKRFEKQFKDNNPAKQANTALSIENDRLLSFIANVGNAMQDLTNDAKTLSAAFEEVQATIGGKAGTSNFKSANVLTGVSGAADIGRIRSAAGFAGQAAGNPRLGDEAVAHAVIRNLLPKVLSDINKAGFGQEDIDIPHSAASELGRQRNFRGLNISREAIDRAVRQTQNALQVKTANETEARQQILDNPHKFAAEVDAATTNINESLQKIIETEEDFANDISKQFSIRRQIEAHIADKLGETLDAITAKDQLILGFQDKRLSIAELSVRDAQHEAINGGGGVGATGANVLALQKRIATLPGQIQNASAGGSNPDVVAFRNLSDELEQTKSAFDKANRALNFFADASKRAASIQTELSKLEGERKAKLGIFQEAAFGAPDQRVKLLRTAQLAGASAQNPDFFKRIGPIFQKDILDFLERIGTGQFAGVQASDLSKQLQLKAGIPANALFAQGPEKEAQEKLKQIATDQIAALKVQEKLAIVAQNQTDRLITELHILNEQLAGRAAGALNRASGGIVPGRGNRDSVPAMLTPGEFVINKNAAASIGMGRLSRMNKFASGGRVEEAMARLQRKKIEDAANIGRRGAVVDGNLISPVELRTGFANTKAFGDTRTGFANGKKFVPRNEPSNPSIPKGDTGFINGPFGGGIPRGGNARAATQPRVVRNPLNLRFGNQPLNPGIAPAGPVNGLLPNVGNGQPGPSTPQGGAEFSQAIQNFSQTSGGLVTALNNFPRTIELNANHKVEVILNGAEVLQSLLPSLQTMVINQTNEAIEKLKTIGS